MLVRCLIDWVNPANAIFPMSMAMPRIDDEADRLC